MADNPFEIPQALRDMSEQTLKQAHAAYDRRAPPNHGRTLKITNDSYDLTSF